MMIRCGARQAIAQVINAELGQMLERYDNVMTLSGSARWCGEQWRVVHDVSGADVQSC